MHLCIFGNRNDLTCQEESHDCLANNTGKRAPSLDLTTQRRCPGRIKTFLPEGSVGALSVWPFLIEPCESTPSSKQGAVPTPQQQTCVSLGISGRGVGHHSFHYTLNDWHIQGWVLQFRGIISQECCLWQETQNWKLRFAFGHFSLLCSTVQVICRQKGSCYTS